MNAQDICKCNILLSNPTSTFISSFLSQWDPAHVLINPHCLFLSWGLLVFFFPSRSSQFSGQIQPFPDSPSFTLPVTVRSGHTSSLPAHLSTNPALDCPAGPSLITKTQPCVLHTSAVRVLRIAQFSILFLYELHWIYLAFIGTCLITLCNTFERTETFSLKRKSSIDSNDSEDSYTIFPSVQIKWSQISASLRMKACKYAIILCFALLHGPH